MAFELALDKNYEDIAEYFIKAGRVSINWKMVEKMISRNQMKIVKKCIKY